MGLVAPIIAAAIAVMAAGVANQTRLTVIDEIDRGWRGTYDLLVRSAGDSMDIEETHGVIEPNFLSFDGAGGLSRDDVEAIRTVSGVEVAAPAATVGLMRYRVPHPLIYVDRSSIPDEPTAYRVSWRATTSDGVVNHPVSSGELTMALGQTDDPTVSPVAGSSVSGSWDEFGVTIDLGALPELASNVIAVDPEAEAKLLGASELDLASLGRVPAGQRTVGTFDPAAVPDQFDDDRFLLESLANRSEAAKDRPVLPVLVAQRLPGGLQFEATVRRGEALATLRSPTDDDARPNAPQLGTTELDATGSLRPLLPSSLTMVWPGSDDPRSRDFLTSPPSSFVPDLVTRPSYESLEPGDDGSPRFRVVPQEVVGIDGRPAAASSGLVRSYRGLEEVDAGVTDFVLAPMGSFALPSHADGGGSQDQQAPLGAYAPTVARITDASASLTDTPTGQRLLPNLNPLGFLTPSPVAITDIASAEVIRGENAIDVVRVRVNGVDEYGTAGVARVEDVATRIAELGHEVDVVAGASPADVMVAVDDYLPPEFRGDLGMTAQEWTTLGAASRIDEGLGVSTRGLLVLAGLVAVFVAAACHWRWLLSRHGEHRLLLDLGFGPRAVVSWFLREALVAALAAVLPAVVLLVTGGTNFFSLAIAAAAALAIVTVTGAWLLSESRSQHGVRRLGLGRFRESLASVASGSGPGWVAWRGFARNPGPTIVTGGAIAAVAGSAALGGEVLLTLADRAGATKLAVSVLGASMSWVATLLALLALAGLLLLVLLERTERNARAAHTAVLKAAGWDRTALARLRVSKLLNAGVLAWCVAVLPVIALTTSLAGNALRASLVLAVLCVGQSLVPRSRSASLSIGERS